jgi:hypothetical protein
MNVSDKCFEQTSTCNADIITEDPGEIHSDVQTGVRKRGYVKRAYF